jgi:hypothetical protein
MDEALAVAPTLALPRLVLVGERDEVVPSAAYDALLDRLAGPGCLVVRYPEGWHLLLRDLQRARVFADILAWLEGRTPPSGGAKACAAAAREPTAGWGKRSASRAGTRLGDRPPRRLSALPSERVAPAVGAAKPGGRLLRTLGHQAFGSEH